MGATDSVRSWIELLTAGVRAPERLGLRFAGCRIVVQSNSRRLLEKLAYYYKDFVSAATRPDVTIAAVEAAAPELGADLIVKTPDPGKKKIKEEYLELEDGRLVRKRLTGMVFVFGRMRHLAVGPCVENDNQVVNFINSRFIQQRLEHGDLLCHSSAASRGGRSVAIGGRSGMGKSTLALHLASRGWDFQTNDRLLLSKTDGAPLALGVPKLPRINPGTILHNDRLREVMQPEDLTEWARMPAERLWNLERKYDVHLDQCFGPGLFRLRGELEGVVYLNWQADREEWRATEIDVATREDFLESFRKPAGLFYLAGPGAASQHGVLEPYVELLRECRVIELNGAVDFRAAAEVCEQILGAPSPDRS